MTTLTSGARHADPYPYMTYKNTAATGGRCETLEYSEPRVIDGDVWTLAYTPRPEFDNHNPVLSYFRDALASGEYDNTARLARRWGDLIRNGYDWEEEDGVIATPGHQAHALRVLRKLGALSS